MSSAFLKVSSSEVLRPAMASRRWLGMAISVSTASLRSRMPSSAWRMRFLPSNWNGLVTTATVSAPSSLAMRATTGAPPVPVPPPMPAVMNTMSAPRELVTDGLGVLERRLPPDLRVGARAQPLGQLRAELDLGRRQVRAQRLHVGVGGDELHAGQARRDHRVDGIAAAAADADDLDARTQHLTLPNQLDHLPLLPRASPRSQQLTVDSLQQTSPPLDCRLSTVDSHLKRTLPPTPSAAGASFPSKRASSLRGGM